MRAILLHVIESERRYARGVGALRGSTAAAEASRRLLRTPTDATLMLLEGREELLRAIAGVDEETFYRLAPFKTEEGHGQEYSILSLIENVANHEREHAAQMRSLLA